MHYNLCSSQYYSSPANALPNACHLYICDPSTIHLYQLGASNVFKSWKVHSRGSNEAYLDNFSFMHGSPRQHIWSLAVAILSTRNPGHSTCPCREELVLHHRPDYIEDYYHCDSGNLQTTYNNIIYKKLLFEGTGCPSDSLCCDPPFSLGSTGK